MILSCLSDDRHKTKCDWWEASFIWVANLQWLGLTTESQNGLGWAGRDLREDLVPTSLPCVPYFIGYQLFPEPMLTLWKGGWTEDRWNRKARSRHCSARSSCHPAANNKNYCTSNHPPSAVLLRSTWIQQPHQNPPASLKSISAYDRARLLPGNPPQYVLLHGLIAKFILALCIHVLG